MKLGNAAVKPGLPLKYFQKFVGVGKQKTLPYLGTAIMSIFEADLKNDPVERRFLLWAALTVMEQYCLDENWDTAWKMFDLQQPDWTAHHQADLGLFRRESPEAYLLDPAWVSAVVGRIKDEEVLAKRRGGKGKGADGDKDSPEGARAVNVVLERRAPWLRRWETWGERRRREDTLEGVAGSAA